MGAGVSGRLAGGSKPPEPAPMLPELLPRDSDLCGFPEGFRNGSNPIGVISSAPAEVFLFLAAITQSPHYDSRPAELV